MGPRAGRGVTLVELLVAVVIVVLLLALLVPATFSVWDVVRQSQCMNNLNTIWKATGVWRADKKSQLLVTGGGWAGRLLPYVDKDRSVFECPGAIARINLLNTDGAGGSGKKVTGPERTEISMEFDIYWQTPSGSGKRGALFVTIPVSNHPWVWRRDKGTSIRYEIDDEGATSGVPLTPGVYNSKYYDDIEFEVFYEEGQPTRLKTYVPRDRGSSVTKYIYDFRVNGEILIEHWGLYLGQEFKIDNFAILGDYGLSRCTYQTIHGEVKNVDPKQFFIMDYPKSLANYGDLCPETPDAWYKYFIVWTPEEWDRQFGGPDVGTWQDYQSLRHRGRANVLFCDGHVETLGPAELAASDPRWWYQGR